jgi:hypothetical protein
MKFAWFSKLSLPKQLLLMLAGILPLLWGIIALDLSSRRELGVANSGATFITWCWRFPKRCVHR